MTHTDNSAFSSLVVSMDERALQECTNNTVFVLRVYLFSFWASGIKPCTCNHRYKFAGGGGEIGRFNLRRSPNRKRDKMSVNQSLIHMCPFPPTLAPIIFICPYSSQ